MQSKVIDDCWKQVERKAICSIRLLKSPAESRNWERKMMKDGVLLYGFRFRANDEMKPWLHEKNGWKQENLPR